MQFINYKTQRRFVRAMNSVGFCPAKVNFRAKVKRENDFSFP